MAEMYRYPSASPYPIALFGLGLWAPILDDELFEAAGAGPITGVLAGTLAVPALSATGAVALRAIVAGTLDAPGLSASGAVAVQGGLGGTLAMPGLEATGAVAVRGALADGAVLSVPALTATGTGPATTAQVHIPRRAGRGRGHKSVRA
jgi:hypothetical protein